MPPAKLRPAQRSPLLGQALGALSLIGQLSARRESNQIRRDDLELRQENARVAQSIAKQKANTEGQNSVANLTKAMLELTNSSLPGDIRVGAYNIMSQVVRPDLDIRLTDPRQLNELDVKAKQLQTLEREVGVTSPQFVKSLRDFQGQFSTGEGFKVAMTHIRDIARFQIFQDGIVTEPELQFFLNNLRQIPKGITAAEQKQIVTQQVILFRTVRDNFQDRGEFVPDSVRTIIRAGEKFLDIDETSLSATAQLKNSRLRLAGDRASKERQSLVGGQQALGNLVNASESNFESLETDFQARSSTSSASRLLNSLVQDPVPFAFTDIGSSASLEPGARGSSAFVQQLHSTRERIQRGVVEDHWRKKVQENPQLVSHLTGTKGDVDQVVSEAEERRDVLRRAGDDTTIIDEQIKAGKNAQTYLNTMRELARRATRRLDRSSIRAGVEGERTDVSLMAELLDLKGKMGSSMKVFDKQIEANSATLTGIQQSRATLFDAAREEGLSPSEQLDLTKVNLNNIKLANTEVMRFVLSQGISDPKDPRLPEAFIAGNLAVGNGRGTLSGVEALLLKSPAAQPNIQQEFKTAISISSGLSSDKIINADGSINVKAFINIDPVDQQLFLDLMEDQMEANPRIEKLGRGVINRLKALLKVEVADTASLDAALKSLPNPNDTRSITFQGNETTLDELIDDMLEAGEDGKNPEPLEVGEATIVYDHKLGAVVAEVGGKRFQLGGKNKDRAFSRVPLKE